MKFNFITKREADKISDTRTLITKQTFFAGDGRIGYMERGTLSDLVEQLEADAPGLLRQYRHCFECVKENFTITTGLNKNKHTVSGADYYYLRFKKGLIELPATVYEVERIGQFIKDYAYGLIRTDFTIEDLIEEARSN